MTATATLPVLLLVEDNRDDEELTLRALRKSNIANPIVVAHDGVEALDYLFGTGVHEGRDTRVRPQLILLDLQLPRINGLGVLKRIRQDERLKDQSVVVLTASNEEEDVVRSYALGAQAYVRKPVSFEQFTAAVKTLGSFWLLLNERPQMRAVE